MENAIDGYLSFRFLFSRNKNVGHLRASVKHLLEHYQEQQHYLQHFSRRSPVFRPARISPPEAAMQRSGHGSIPGFRYCFKG
jgi:hypothetical protein